MKRKLTIRGTVSLVLVVLAALFLTTCGGGDGGVVTPVAQTTISGTVSAPGGQVAFFKQEKTMFALLDVLFPSAHATLYGTEPVPGALVELIEVDDGGNQMGDVLASTTTSITGDYTLTLPAGLDLAANLVVRVTGTNNVVMRAQVVEQTVNIDPTSEYVLQRLVQSGTSLSNLTTDDVVLLRGHVEEFDLTVGADLSAITAELDAVAGTTLDDLIVTVTSDQGVTPSIAGEYHLGNFEIQLRSNRVDDLNPFEARPPCFPGQESFLGATRVMLEQESLTVTDQGSGDFRVQGQITSSNADLSRVPDANQGIPYNLQVETSLESDDVTVTMQVLGDGSFIVILPFEEELLTGAPFGIRVPPKQETFYPVGTGVFVAQGADAGVFHPLTAEGDAVDPRCVTGRETGYFFDVLARKSQNLTNSSISGNYGLVTFGLELGADGVRTVLVNRSQLNATNGTLTGVTGFVALTRVPDPAGLFQFAGDANVTGSYELDLDGGLTVMLDVSGGTGQVDSDGFVGNGGDIIVLSDILDVEDSGTLVSAERSATFGVRLPTGSVDLNGKQFRFFLLEMGFDIGGGTELIRTPVGTASFDATTVNVSGIESTIRRGNDRSDYTPASESFTAQGTYNLDDVSIGRITMTFPDPDPLTMEGFVSADGSVAVFQTGEPNPLPGPPLPLQTGSLGMLIAVETTQ